MVGDDLQQLRLQSSDTTHFPPGRSASKKSWREFNLCSGKTQIQRYECFKRFRYRRLTEGLSWASTVDRRNVVWSSGSSLKKEVCVLFRIYSQASAGKLTSKWEKDFIYTPKKKNCQLLSFLPFVVRVRGTWKHFGRSRESHLHKRRQRALTHCTKLPVTGPTKTNSLELFKTC